VIVWWNGETPGLPPQPWVTGGAGGAKLTRRGKGTPAARLSGWPNQLRLAMTHLKIDQCFNVISSQLCPALVLRRDKREEAGKHAS
jgi:hypothetical protein